MVFITEGQSAAGSIASCRDVNTQAIFVLKGKPLNVWDLKRDVIYKNDELYNLMRSLDIEDNLEGLRYDKVILATDADVDGLHIRNLMITYFFRFFEQLVHDGHLYRAGDAAVPRAQQEADDLLLLRGRARRGGDEARRQEREITRFKGLGEISPAEFKQFIGKEMRLSQVEYAPKHDAGRHPQLLHGQEHARAQRLHHGEPGGAGGGLSSNLAMASKRKSNPEQPELPIVERPDTTPGVVNAAHAPKGDNGDTPTPSPPRAATAPRMSSPRTSPCPRRRVHSSPARSSWPLHRRVDRNFLEYASYVIRDRAIPNLEDGLKPVQRRILWSLHEKDDGRFIKVANVVGHCMQYHPHGDASIGDALVVLANKRYLIEGQGNFGNIFTGDPAAAPRYIECRLTELARTELFNDELTEFVPSYDGRNKEPVTLPGKLPLLLMLGAEGIAVGHGHAHPAAQLPRAARGPDRHPQEEAVQVSARLPARRADGRPRLRGRRRPRQGPRQDRGQGRGHRRHQGNPARPPPPTR